MLEEPFSSYQGLFIHIQDLFPAKDVAIGREWKRRVEHGVLDEPIEYKVYEDDQWCATEINSKAFGWISTVLHFVTELSDACKKIGFKVDWGYKSGEFVGEQLPYHQKHKNINVFQRKDIDYTFNFDESLPENQVKEKIEFLTVVARK